MKKRISCEIIRDLLPLYVDGQTRPDTSRIISEHLSACPECARMYEEMNTPFPPAANDTPSDGLGKIRRKARMDTLAAVCAAILVIFIVTLFKLFVYGSPDSSFSSMIEISGETHTISVSGTVSGQNKAYSHYKIEKQEDTCRLIVYSCMPSFIHGRDTFSIELAAQDTPLKIGGLTITPDCKVIGAMANALYDNAEPADIADKLGLRKAFGGFSLKLLSTSAPYKWEIVFREHYSYETAKSKSALMEKYACVMLALSGTSKEINWCFVSDDGRGISSSLDRNDAERMLKSPIQEYAESPEAVQQLLDELGIF